MSYTLRNKNGDRCVFFPKSQVTVCGKEGSSNLGFSAPNPRSKVLALDQDILPNSYSLWNLESSNGHISKWYLQILSRVMSEPMLNLKQQIYHSVLQICLPFLLNTWIVRNGAFPIWQSSEQETLPWYTVKLLSHLVFLKVEKRMNYFFFWQNIWPLPLSTENKSMK